jgi:membrane protein YqaA with SNARE-associated domain
MTVAPTDGEEDQRVVQDGGVQGKAERPGFIRRQYDRLIRAAHGPRAQWTLAGVAFAESSFFPIPPDVVLIPMMLANPRRAWWLAGLCTVASVIGGLVGYAIGYFLFATVGSWLINLYGLQSGFHEFQQKYAEWGAWIILAKGVTPIPYKLVTITSGVAQFPLGLFILSSIVSRGLRFFLIAVLMRVYGEKVRYYLEKYMNWAFWGFIVLVALGFAVMTQI